MKSVIALMMMQLLGSCKEIPWLPDHFDEWLALVKMVKEHVYCFSTCKALRSSYGEMHRCLKLRFLDWPIFTRKHRLRVVIPLLRVGDHVHIETLGWPFWFDGRVAKIARAAITFDRDKDDEKEIIVDEPYVVRRTKIVYVELVSF
jgi:hypothetical protein